MSTKKDCFVLIGSQDGGFFDKSTDRLLSWKRLLEFLDKYGTGPKTDDIHTCRACGGSKHFIHFQHVRCSDSTEEYEVCTDCKSAFLTMQYGFLGILKAQGKYEDLICKLYALL